MSPAALWTIQWRLTAAALAMWWGASGARP